MPLAVGVALAVSGILAAASPGETSTVGQTFTPTTTCESNLVHLQTTSPGSQYAVPAAGTITSWSFRAAGSAPTIRFKIGRPVGGDTYMIVGESQFRTPAPNVVSTYPVSISVQAGDVIGFYSAAGQSGSAGPCVRLAQPGYTGTFHSGDVPVGQTASFVNSNGVQLDVSARFRALTTTETCDGRPATVVGDGRHDVFGTMHGDVIVGTGHGEEIVGLRGGDRICARGGADDIDGNPGDDRIFGGHGDDSIDGGPGKDACHGGPGDDHKSRCES